MSSMPPKNAFGSAMRLHVRRSLSYVSVSSTVPSMPLDVRTTLSSNSEPSGVRSYRSTERLPGSVPTQPHVPIKRLVSKLTVSSWRCARTGEGAATASITTAKRNARILSYTFPLGKVLTAPNRTWYDVNDALPLTTPLGDAIVQIRLPMAGNPLRHINAYLLEDDDGYTLVDCGWKTDDVLAALRAGLEGISLGVGDLARIVITHAHFDHYGLAGTLRRAGVRELHMHGADWAFARLLLTDPRGIDRAADAWLARNGYAADDAFDDEHMRRNELTEPTHTIDDGARIGRLRAVWTPGHSPGHCCFVDRRSGKMLTGDHVLDPITPHVGVWGERGSNPLDDYVASLRKVSAIGATGVLPAHGEPFDDLRRRTDELLAHEAEREARVLAALEPGAADATSVARALPWTRRMRAFDELEPAHRQFAVAETLAHLVALHARDVVTRDDDANPTTYARSNFVRR